ncbi:MAG: hypothetical protein R2867_01605 [Caldilineaceae bacterium]
MDNPDEAFAIALQTIPEAGGENEAANRAIFDAVLSDWSSTAGQQPGATELTAWQSAAEFMQRIGLVDTVVPAEELFTNEFCHEWIQFARRRVSLAKPTCRPVRQPSRDG